MERYLAKQVRKDLEKKMVFIGGPRQVGKTTLARNLFSKAETGYLNWDIDEDRTKLLKRQLPDRSVWIFDEIHKYRKWRNYLKGVYDAIKVERWAPKKILVTGSARLDYYRFGGDSLQGRYHYHRLMPLSFREIGAKNVADLESLFRYGGFPEPFFAQSEKETRRWTNEYAHRLFREDLTSLERITDIGTLELMVYRLPEIVGAPFSINSLREDLQIAHATLAKWVSILERLYLIFRISPFGAAHVKAIKKEPKLYLYNWTSVESDGPRFENLVAVHLLKYAYWLQDTEGRRIDLRYFRLKGGEEVDFVMLENGKPFMFVECKLNDDSVNPRLRTLVSRFPSAKAFQIHLRGKKEYQTPEGIRVCPATRLLSELI
ncbi:MAG: ATP-binding protein [Bdellovibrionota bacterium]